MFFKLQLYLNEIGFNIEGFLEGKSTNEIPLTEVDNYHTIFVTRRERGQMYVSAVVDLKNMKFQVKQSQQVSEIHIICLKVQHSCYLQDINDAFLNSYIYWQSQNTL